MSVKNIELLMNRRPRAGQPRLLIPLTLQWQLAATAREPSDADRILAAPEFVDSVKLSVIRTASTQSRIRWLATDPDIRDGDFLLELLELGKCGGRLATVNLLGNRPALSQVVLDLELHPLYPAAARHTVALDQHSRAVDKILSSPQNGFAASVFRARSDVHWLLRNRMTLPRHARQGDLGGEHLQPLTRSWDAITFSEAGDATVDLDALTPAAAGTRRGAASILAAPHKPAPPVMAEASRVARAAIVAAHVRTLSGMCTSVESVPSEVIEAIESTPLSAGVAGPTVGYPGLRRSMPPSGTSRRAAGPSDHIHEPGTPVAAQHEATDPGEPTEDRRPMIVRHWRV
jgi:hypothetical protein